MARARQTRSERGTRRAARREARADETARAAYASRRMLARTEWAGWAVATGLLAVVAAGALRNKVSWYLAVDQLGYLLSARDLLAGRLFHAWPPADALATLLPSPTDVLAQSYLWDDGRLYSRYAPGFPILLALWTGFFGEPAAHALNPALFLALLGLIVTIVWRVHRSPWRGTAAATLVLLCPTGASLWALTVTRDVSAHVCGLAGLAALAGRGRLSPARALAAGLGLGYAGSIRPDAVLYLVPAAILVWSRWRPHRLRASLGRTAGAGALGVALGLAPSLVFYWAATGSLAPPQAVEVEDFFGPPPVAPAEDAGDARVGFPPRAWRGGELEPVSGGGMKLSHLPATLPGNLAKIRQAYGDVLLLLAGLGLATTAVVRPAFALALGAYVVAALLFFSCWGRPYGRYLLGIWLLTPVLIVDGALGTIELVRRLWRLRERDLARWLAGGTALLVLGLLLAAGPRPDAATALSSVTRLLALGTAAGLVVAARWPRRRVGRVAAPALAIALVLLAVGRLSAASPRATFQRPEVERAAATLRQAVKPRAVVLTTEDIGRPVENLEYHGGVNALYLTDLRRWRIPVERAVFFFLVAELEPYLLIPRTLPERDAILQTLRSQSFVLELVADIPPARNYDYFVASSFHGGVELELWHVR